MGCLPYSGVPEFKPLLTPGRCPQSAGLARGKFRQERGTGAPWLAFEIFWATGAWIRPKPAAGWPLRRPRGPWF